MNKEMLKNVVVLGPMQGEEILKLIGEKGIGIFGEDNDLKKRSKKLTRELIKEFNEKGVGKNTILYSFMDLLPTAVVDAHVRAFHEDRDIEITPELLSETIKSIDKETEDIFNDYLENISNNDLSDTQFIKLICANLIWICEVFSKFLECFDIYEDFFREKEEEKKETEKEELSQDEIIEKLKKELENKDKIINELKNK